MTVAITVIHVAVCFILISVILLQAGRGQGLTGASFGSGNVQDSGTSRLGIYIKTYRISILVYRNSRTGTGLESH